MSSNQLVVRKETNLPVLKATKQTNAVLNLIHDDEERRLVEVLKEVNSEIVIKILSRLTSIQWSVALIEKYETYWDWDILLKNKSLPWTQTIEYFSDLWGWNHLSPNESLPWSIELIDRFKDKWEWKSLSSNESLSWSIELIDRFKDKWDWELLSYNSSLPWSIELVDKYYDKWDGEVWAEWGYPCSSDSESLLWSADFIEYFQDGWDWYDLSDNKSLPWSIELIGRFKDKWDWGGLSSNESLPWSIELIEKFYDRWDWGLLSYNESLPWSVELIERFYDKWNWDGRLNRELTLPDAWMGMGLARNASLPWSIEFIERYQDNWSWRAVEYNRNLPWSLELIDRFKDKWDWEALSMNLLPWSIELIEKFYDRWDWGLLSSNKSLPWSIELIEKFYDRWDWERLSSNESLPWSIELIEKFYDRWDWERLSSNSSLPWSIDLIDRFKDKWDWDCLSFKSSLPWSLELIDRFKDKWDWVVLSELLASSIEVRQSYNQNLGRESDKIHREKYETAKKLNVMLERLLTIKSVDELMLYHGRRINSQWQSCATLDALYLVVYLNRIVLKIEEEQKIRDKFIYLAWGINIEGHKKLLGLWLPENEGTQFWSVVLTELKNRGLEDILIFAFVDGLTGLPDAIQNVYPKTQIKFSIDYMVRNSLKFVSRIDYRKVRADLKKVYQASTQEQALRALEHFAQQWIQYPQIVQLWQRYWNHVAMRFAHPDDIMDVIYESNSLPLNSIILNQATNPHKLFPNNQAAFKMVHLAITQTSEKCVRPIRNWHSVLNQFIVMFGERVTKHI